MSYFRSGSRVAVLELRGSVSFPGQADHPLLEINVAEDKSEVSYLSRFHLLNAQVVSD